MAVSAAQDFAAVIAGRALSMGGAEPLQDIWPDGYVCAAR